MAKIRGVRTQTRPWTGPGSPFFPGGFSPVGRSRGTAANDVDFFFFSCTTSFSCLGGLFYFTRLIDQCSQPLLDSFPPGIFPCRVWSWAKLAASSDPTAKRPPLGLFLIFVFFFPPAPDFSMGAWPIWDLFFLLATVCIGAAPPWFGVAF